MKTIPVLLAIVLGFANLSVQSAEPPPRSEKATKLLKERLEIALTILDWTKAKAAAGQTGPDDLMNAQVAVYSSMLDLSSNKEERIKIYTSMLDELKRYTDTLQALFKIGKASNIDLKQHRLREIDIELSIEAERTEK